MIIFRALGDTISQLKIVLSQISDQEYEKALPVLSYSSIGQHARHIIEFYQALFEGYASGVVNYENRQRNRLLETRRVVALDELSNIVDRINLKDKDVVLKSHDPDQAVEVRTTYYRELIYNLEHTVHHMAMIRIGIRQSTNLVIPADFGVAKATVQYRKSIL